MQEHFLKNIEIIDFKCFKNFKAKDFKRVNLISGKNNVGKTALLEASYINTYPYKSENTTAMAISDTIFIRYNQTFFQHLLLGKGIDYIKNIVTEKIQEFDNNSIRSNINNTI